MSQMSSRCQNNFTFLWQDLKKKAKILIIMAEKYNFLKRTQRRKNSLYNFLNWWYQYIYYYTCTFLKYTGSCWMNHHFFVLLLPSQQILLLFHNCSNFLNRPNKGNPKYQSYISAQCPNLASITYPAIKCIVASSELVLHCKTPLQNRTGIGRK